MAFVNKKQTSIGLSLEVLEYAKKKAKSKGMSVGVYIEQLIRVEMEKDIQKNHQ